MTVDDLYAVPREDFVAARDQLAKELTAAGDDDQAKQVKALRKPTVTAWTLNGLARGRPELVAALVDSHRRLRSADTGEVLRAASEARMAAIQQIIDAVEETTEAVRKKMRSTLLAAGTEPTAEEALAAGRLQTELEPGGLGGFEMAAEFKSTGPAPASKAKGGSRRPAAKPTSAKATKARERAERLQREADEAAEEARTLRAEADRGERLAAAAESRAAKKRAAADEASQNLGTG